LKGLRPPLVTHFSMKISLILLGKNTVLLRGAKRREALRHFGPAPGAKGSHTA